MWLCGGEQWLRELPPAVSGAENDKTTPATTSSKTRQDDQSPPPASPLVLSFSTSPLRPTIATQTRLPSPGPLSYQAPFPDALHDTHHRSELYQRSQTREVNRKVAKRERDSRYPRFLVLWRTLRPRNHHRNTVIARFRRCKVRPLTPRLRPFLHRPCVAGIDRTLQMPRQLLRLRSGPTAGTSAGLVRCGGHGKTSCGAWGLHDSYCKGPSRKISFLLILRFRIMACHSHHAVQLASTAMTLAIVAAFLIWESAPQSAV
ncbi:hypothetical protein FN846DRAFT_72549 [Sphaerosporella brunnea]|uniref:Uncharacterized protein n=1 Tax=Sphaerosporella brunnea TaxID=1250544 RepID=A0A5J5EUT9_9PEZI|nr:hypothetical protein FN846DRAFT_72549 [Sphaerosporella brunnea]